ncbi:unnamed protein product [Heterobilharzia americana]|nr:unnamed protein product [Heterobilharzia americana]
MSTILSDNDNIKSPSISVKSIQKSLDLNCLNIVGNDDVADVSNVTQSKSSSKLINDITCKEGQRSTDEIKCKDKVDTNEDEKKITDCNYSSTCFTSHKIDTETRNIMEDNNSIPTASILNTSRNILTQQQCTIMKTSIVNTISKANESTTSSQYTTVNNHRRWRTFNSGHLTKHQQVSTVCQTTTPIHEIINDPTVSNVNQLNRSGFLRHPLRKAMSYVKPQSECITSNKMKPRRQLQHTLTIERTDDCQLNLINKNINRNSLHSSFYQSNSLNKLTTQSHEYPQLYSNNNNNNSDGWITQEVFTGEKTKQKDIRHLNDLLANFLSKSFSTAFKRPLGKCKSHSPSTSFDHDNDKCINPFNQYDNHEMDDYSRERSPTNVLISNEYFPEHNIPTRSQLNQWEKSFDQLLADTDGLSQFHQFLKSEYSEENIEFWMICELYKHLPTTDLCEESQKIYKLYLAPQSPREVNLDSETRNQTISGLINPTNQSFILAQQTIKALMNKDSYHRFLRSSFYFHLKQLVWHTYPSNDVLATDESTKSTKDNQLDYPIEINKSSLLNKDNEYCSRVEEDQIKDIPTCLPLSQCVIQSPNEFSTFNQINHDIHQSIKMIPSPIIDQFHDPISINDYQCIVHDELPNSVHCEPGPHSPELGNSDYSSLLNHDDMCKIKKI